MSHPAHWPYCSKRSCVLSSAPLGSSTAPHPAHYTRTADSSCIALARETPSSYFTTAESRLQLLLHPVRAHTMTVDAVIIVQYYRVQSLQVLPRPVLAPPHAVLAIIPRAPSDSVLPVFPSEGPTRRRKLSSYGQ